MAAALKILDDIYGPMVVYEIVYGLPPLERETVDMDLP